MPTLVLPFPTIDPVLIEFGPFAIRWYALAYIAGLLLGWWSMRALVTSDRLWGAQVRPGLLDVDDFVVYATLGTILGGRLGYVLFYAPGYYLQNPLDALAVWSGGMSFHGGFLGVVAAMAIFAWRRGLPLWTLFDLAGAVAPIGLFFGRIANFINAELWGRTTDVAWAVVFPSAGPEPRHPSQLYEAALEGLLLLAVVRIVVARGGFRRPGLVAGTFALGYGLARIFVEFFRVPDAHIGYLGPGLTMGILLSLPMVIAGALAVARALSRPPNPEGPPRDPKAATDA
ncbi:prolipoprotein diacylglyceryl transferase [Stappia sp. ES.058]|uniref:prolipoprotein diacylglyceryl transferase n=1 Tax=Stappia sp. ES.058 TaxID=1881061 RepID=UPI00087B3B49|nr:prolipoprotein diacylglyceryl transferase [Stappia sp. ES.058]SDU29237.1 Prolipoprotein diacylglyceryl transferase [Stappia sp. ES.058]